jgi:hypothetical protein
VVTLRASYTTYRAFGRLLHAKLLLVRILIRRVHRIHFFSPHCILLFRSSLVLVRSGQRLGMRFFAVRTPPLAFVFLAVLIVTFTNADIENKDDFFFEATLKVYSIVNSCCSYNSK